MFISGVDIVGVASAVPRLSEKVSEIAGFDTLQSKKFTKVTGIVERRLASNDIMVSDLIAASVEKLLTDVSIDKSKIAALITITQTGDNAAPGVALKVSSKLGLKEQLIAFDINLGCSSFPYGLATMASMMKSLNLDYALLCIGDISSRICHPLDMATYPLFGDAGSAILLKLDTVRGNVMYFDLNSDGAGREDIFIQSGGLASEVSPLRLKHGEKNAAHMNLKGANVFAFAINKAPASIRKVLKSANIEAPEVCILHQANKKINKFIENELKFDNCIFPSSLEKFGNTSSVTIPLTIVTNYGGTSLSKNILACGFGVGLSWGSVLTSLSNCKICELVEI